MPNKDYSDIINRDRPTSRTHPPMPIDARAAQFSPYAALVGHKDLIIRDEDEAEHKTDLDQDIIIIDTEST